jgi:hypothetical protein
VTRHDEPAGPRTQHLDEVALTEEIETVRWFVQHEELDDRPAMEEAQQRGSCALSGTEGTNSAAAARVQSAPP